MYDSASSNSLDPFHGTQGATADFRRVEGLVLMLPSGENNVRFSESVICTIVADPITKFIMPSGESIAVGLRGITS
jgi:hypothetical protein